MKKQYLLWAVCFSAAICRESPGVLLATDPVSAKTALIEALDDLEKATSLTFRGVVRRTPYGGPAKEFEIWRSPQGELVFLPVGELPGLAVYDDGHCCIARNTQDVDEPLNSIDAAMLTDELPWLLQPSAIRKFVAAMDDLKITFNGTETVYTVPLSKRLFRAVPRRSLLDRVQRLVVRIVCTDQGRVKALEFQVEHRRDSERPSEADLVKELQELEKQSTQDDKKKADEQPSLVQLLTTKMHKERIDQMKTEVALAQKPETAIYSLTASDAEPSQRLRAFRAEMRGEARRTTGRVSGATGSEKRTQSEAIRPSFSPPVQAGGVERR